MSRQPGARATVTAPTPAVPVPRQDFVALGTLGVVLALLMLLGAEGGPLGLVRLLATLLFVLFVPGYCFIAALFPAADDLEWAQRIGASLGMSVAAVPLLALLLDQLPWGMQPWLVLLAEFVFSLLCAAAAMLRRARLPAGAAPPTFAIQQPTALLDELIPTRRRPLLISATVIVLIFVAASWLALSPRSDRGAEFYMLGSQGQARDYPRTVSAGQTLSVTLGIVNDDDSAHSYRVEVWAADRIASTGRVKIAAGAAQTLQAGARDEAPISWQIPAPGAAPQVEFLLFADSATEPTRRLLLPLDRANP